jgi:hypothetical protein
MYLCHLECKKNKKKPFLRDGAQAEFIGKLKIRFRFPAILKQFLVWGKACKLCLKMRFPQTSIFKTGGRNKN